LVNAQCAGSGQRLLQMGNGVAVDFHRIQGTRAYQQRSGDRTQPGADFDQALLGFGVVRLRIDSVDDAAYHRLIVQEVLAETFAWDMHGGAQHKRSRRAG
jgi:hypothetical protein